MITCREIGTSSELVVLASNLVSHKAKLKFEFVVMRDEGGCTVGAQFIREWRCNNVRCSRYTELESNIS